MTMKLDELKQGWQESIQNSTEPVVMNEVIAVLEQQTIKIDKEIKRRDILEISIALLLIPFWIFGLFTTAGTIQTVGLILAILSCLYIPYRLVQAKKLTVSKSTDNKSFLEREKQKISQQKELLETIVSWYIAPLTISIVLITIGATVDDAGIPHLSQFLIIYYGFVALLVIGIYLLNKRAAKKKFGPLLNKIEARLAELQ